MSPTSLFNKYNFFFICGHGVEYATEIIAKIEEIESLKVITSIFYQPPKIKKFISKVFQLEDKLDISIDEIVNYMVKTSKTIILVIVKQYTNEEFYNQVINGVENDIRDQFEKFAMDSNNRAHIIYGFTDASSTEKILKMLGICHNPYEFDKICVGGIPYFLDNWTEIRIKKMNIDEIYARIPVDGVSRIMKIEDTPCYRALINGMEEYKDYQLYHQGLNPFHYYSIDKYLYLSETLEYMTAKYCDKYIFVNFTEGKHVIVDGLHRAAILKHRGIHELLIAEVSF